MNKQLKINIMEFKGTKGKWEISENSKFILNDSELAICKSTEGLLSKDWKANALLISKAPEMLEMLKGILKDSKNGIYLTKEDLPILEKLIKEATEL